MDVFFLVGLGLILFGALFAMIGMGVGVYNKKKARRCIVETVATVIDISANRSRNSNGGYSTTYAPVFEYFDGQKNVRRQASISTNYNSCPQIDEQVTLYFNPDNTKEFIVENDKSTKLIVGIFSGIGVLVAAGGFVFLFI